MSDERSATFCPYVGLQPFTPAERPYFFGRHADVRVIASNMYASTITIFYGASGVGKSSVLLAGVVPDLQSRPNTAVVVFRDWHRSDAADVIKAGCVAAAALALGKKFTHCTDLPFDDLLASIASSEGLTFLVIFDQFEEYFVYHAETTAADDFDAEIARAINRDDVDANFLFSMRDDGLAQLDRFKKRIPNLLRNMLRLRQLEPEAARDAIVGPIDSYNKRVEPTPPIVVEPELVDAVLAQVRNETPTEPSAGSEVATDTAPGRIETPLLQLVMTRIWEEERAQGSNVLRLDTFERRLKGVTSLVEAHLARVLDALGPDEREVCYRVFGHLVTPSRTKIACRVDDLEAWAGDLRRLVRSLLASLHDRRILRAMPRPAGQLEGSYEIFHDVLAPAVIQWIENHAHQKELRRKDAELRAARRWTLLMAMLCVCAAIALGVAWIKNNEARRSRRLAIQARNVAHDLLNVGQAPRKVVVSAVKAMNVAAKESDAALDSSADAAARLALPRIQASFEELGAFSSAIRDMVLSPDGKQLATLASDRTVEIVDLVSPGRRTKLVGDGFAPTSVAWDRRGSTIVTGGADGKVRIWSVADRRELAALPLGSAVAALATNASGRRRLLAVAHANHEVSVVDLDRVAVVWRWRAAALADELPRPIVDDRVPIAISVDGGAIVVVDSAAHAMLMRLVPAGPDRLDSLEPIELRFEDGVSAVAFSPDGRFVALGGANGFTSLLQASTGDTVSTLVGHDDAVQHVAFDPRSTEGYRLGTASADGLADVWRLPAEPGWLDGLRSQNQMILSGHRGVVSAVEFGASGSVVTASWDRTVRVWRELPVAGRFEDEFDEPFGVAFSPDGALLAVVDSEHVWIFDGHSGERVFRLEIAGAIAFGPDPSALTVFDASGRVSRWNARSGDALGEARCDVSEARYASSSEDMTLAAISTASGEVVLCDLRTSTTLKRWPESDVNIVTLSPDGKRFATASERGVVDVYEVGQDGRSPQRSFVAHQDRIEYLEFSRDGSRLLTAGAYDGEARVWDVEGARKLCVEKEPEPVRTASISIDGRYFAVARGSAGARVWDVDRCEHPVELDPHQRRTVSLSFSPDGKRIATLGAEGEVHIHDLDRDRLLARAREVVPEAFEPPAVSSRASSATNAPDGPIPAP